MKVIPILLGALVVGGLAVAGGVFASASAQTVQTDARAVVPAPIESVEVVPSGSAPTGHALKVTAVLPSGCAEAFDTGFERTGDVIVATVTNTVPSDAETPCTKIYRTYETLIDLGTGFVPEESYIAYVNGTEVPFVAHGGIVPPQRIEVAAPIESVEVTSTLSLPPIYVAQIVAGLPGGCAEPGDVEVNRFENAVRIDVSNTIPADEAVCTLEYRTYPLNVELGSDFVSGETYMVLVNGTSTAH
jgi:hypothetical protein